MTNQSYETVHKLIDDIIKILKNSPDLASASIRHAFSGQLYDNPTTSGTIVVGPYETKIEPHFDKQLGYQDGWLLSVTIFTDITMPVFQSDSYSWLSYLRISDALGTSALSDLLMSAECGTPGYNRNCRAFITRAKFVFEYMLD